jgi:hypothetical protein
MDFVDFAAFADTWMTDIDPEPSTSSTELLVNNDFTANKASVPNAGDNDEITPTGWTFVPSTFDTNEAGIWNVSQMGTVGNPVVIQPRADLLSIRNAWRCCLFIPKCIESNL